MTFHLRKSYFAIANPLDMFVRLLNPYSHRKVIEFNGYELEVMWTSRAEIALRQRDEALLAELQLYFSCVVQKRVLFHTQSEHDYVVVNEYLKLCFRPVEALACDAEHFAKHHPVKQQLSSRSATRMHPKQCLIDYVKDQWQGEFTL